MCRFVAYLSPKKELIANLVEKPNNSLINQSKRSEDGASGVNADGLGISWYNEDDKIPGIFKSIQPAWNDANLKHLARKIKSECFLGHIRASTIGDVNQSNCHPFSLNEFSFVHNGTIRQFKNIKRDLLNQLSSELFLNINGSTDSEHLFYLIMHYHKIEKLSLEEAILQSFQWIVDKQKSLDGSNHSKINTAFTNGHFLIATRFASKGKSCLSLFYSSTKDSIIVSSERLDNTSDNWIEMPKNHYLYVDKDNLSPIIKPFTI